MEALSSIQVCAPSDFLFYLHRIFAQPCSKIQLVHMIGSQIRDFELAGDFLLAIQQAPGGKAGLLVGRAEALPLSAARFANIPDQFDQISILDW